MLRCRVNTEIPFLAAANSQHAVNHTVDGVRVRSKIVPALTDVRHRQLAHRRIVDPNICMGFFTAGDWMEGAAVGTGLWDEPTGHVRATLEELALARGRRRKPLPGRGRRLRKTIRRDFLEPAPCRL